MNFEGYVDHTENGEIFGWVRNRDEPQQRVAVTIRLSNGWSKTLLADQPREDLRASSIGDGRYGFKTSVPFKIAHEGHITVSVSVKRSDYILENSGRQLLIEHPIQLIAGDISNNCNLRCPFCITDYSLTKGLRNMPAEVFEKAIPLLPLVPDGMFWLSCMHEATVHPQIIDFIQSVPSHLRKKLSFTTNLCKNLTDDTLRALANSNIHSIRISIDSIDPERFAELRKGGRLEKFLANLTRLSHFMKSSQTAPKIRYITMAFASNVHEILPVIMKCKEILPAYAHEVRFIFYQPHIAKWGQKNILPLDQWNEMKQEVESHAGSEHVEFYDPFPDTHSSFEKAIGIDTYKPSPAVFGGTCNPKQYTPADPLVNNRTKIPNEPLTFRLRWDGLLSHEKMPESDFLEYIQNLTPKYFVDMRIASQPEELDGWQKGIYE
ncbi:radical SAM protein [Pelagicoccus sp. NFK12]|uniref:Radical SAM protein n=1 Tax=Pelagicoccus enzymogenes TaxID=2773457 RepID=A0A927F5E2_9BACT|nr:radical SAM protein [Pelagicoccus enzymogenes]MBD5778703.1 radical SAM protein [Pelagicoccus enzymogenes]